MYFHFIFNRNPYPGELFNHPNGSDVYKGLQIDYKGKVSITSIKN